jgi:ketosteroid isomerase-like protein
MDKHEEIEEMVQRETRAWDTQDLDLLMSLFHPDMVWPWPPHPLAHDPVGWVLELGRFNYDRWRAGWQQLFETHRLVHNRRRVEKIVVSREGDGAFAVVDIDTLWRDCTGKDNHWKGRVCKVYTRMSEGWKLIMHTGVLDYSRCPQP